MNLFKKKNKFLNQIIETPHGRFHSKGEANRFYELLSLEAAAAITALQKQVRIPLIVNGIYIADYRADFTYRKEGVFIIEDFKSKITQAKADYQMKKLLVEALYGIKIFESGVAELKKRPRNVAKAQNLMKNIQEMIYMEFC